MQTYILAHRESWEMSASRLVNQLVQQALEEHARKQKQSDAETSIPVEIVSLDRMGKKSTIPVSSSHTLVDHELEDQTRQNGNETRVSRFWSLLKKRNFSAQTWTENKISFCRCSNWLSLPCSCCLVRAVGDCYRMKTLSDCFLI